MKGVELLLLKLKYDPVTGSFTWKVPTKGRIINGALAGYINKDGYIIIRSGGVGYRAHHLVWYIHHGEIPEGYVLDHKNLKRSDNRISNLRLATRQQNNQNSSTRRKNDGLPRNIRKLKSGYQVKIKLNKTRYVFGIFEDLELAQLVEESAREKYHGDFKY